MRTRGGRRGPPRAMIAAVAALTAALTGALTGGCAGHEGHGTASRARAANFPHDAATLLAAGTGNLEGSASFRLTMRVLMPKQDGRPAYRMDMGGVWDARRGAGRMDGLLRDAHATVLSIGDTEYVSVPPATRRLTGRTWLRAARGTRTFAGFADVHRIAMLLRTAGRSALSATAEAGATWHVRGTIDRAAALRAIPDPAVRAFADLLPATTRFDLWTDDAGRPNRVALTPSGDAKKVGGTVELSGFGSRPTVQEPTANQILTSLPKNGRTR
jgi:hypothetical protein